MDSTEYSYKLKSPFTYHSKGGQLEAASILLKAPTSKSRSEVMHIKQGFMRAAAETQEGKGERKDKKDMNEEVDPQDLLILFMSSKTQDVNIYFDTFERLLIKDGGLVDGVEPLTSFILEKLSVEDLENMFGLYLKFFLVASFLKSSG